MTLILSGTNGLSDVDGSAATPAIRGTDTNTGIFFPAADTIGFAEGGAEVARFDSSGNLGLGTTTPNTAGYGGAVLGIYGGSNTGGNIWLTSDTTAAGNRAGRIGFGTEGNSTNKEIARVWSLAAGSTAGNLGGDLLFSTKPDGGALTERARIDSSGNFGIGTSSPLDRLDVVSATSNRSRIRSSGASEAVLLFQNSTTGTSTGDGLYLGIVGAADAYVWNYENNPLIFGTNNTERMRITNAGNVGIGDNNPSTARLLVTSDGSVLDNVYVKNTNTSAGTNNSVVFVRGSNVVGTITTTLSATAYNTSSDYRLKNITGPVTGSGEFIDALKPKVGTWKADGSKFVGFLAHEVQEVSPGSVTGTKDAVDEEGNPIMQGMEYGSAEFIANIIAELQALRQRVAALESGAK